MRDSGIGRCVRAAAVLAVIAGVAPAARAQNSPDETAPSNRMTAAPDRGGVIKPPPGEDRGLRKPPPANGSTITVIPPPGTAGNQPDVVPK